MAFECTNIFVFQCAVFSTLEIKTEYQAAPSCHPHALYSKLCSRSKIRCQQTKACEMIDKRLVGFLYWLNKRWLSHSLLLFSEPRAITETGAIPRDTCFCDICQLVWTIYVQYSKTKSPAVPLKSVLLFPCGLSSVSFQEELSSYPHAFLMASTHTFLDTACLHGPPHLSLSKALFGQDQINTGWWGNVINNSIRAVTVLTSPHFAFTYQERFVCHLPVIIQLVGLCNISESSKCREMHIAVFCNN